MLVMPVEPGEPVEPVEPGEPGEPGEPVEPSEPGEPGKPVPNITTTLLPLPHPRLVVVAVGGSNHKSRLRSGMS